MIEPNFRSYRSVLNKYIRSLNGKPNKKSKTSPQRHDRDVSVAASLMTEPNQARSAYLGEDFRINEVGKFKAENTQVIGILKEIAARKAELVEKTPFDNFEDNIVLQIIDNRLNEIYEIISNSPQITRQYVEEIIEPVEESLNQLHNKVDQLLSKDKKHREILFLRDPINSDLFPIFLANAGSKAVRQKDLKQSQLRLAYTLLYFTGLRVNEIRIFQEKDIHDKEARPMLGDLLS